MQETATRKIRMKRPRSAGLRPGNSATSFSRQANTRGWRRRNIWIGSPTRTFVCSDKSNSALPWTVCRKSAVPSRGTRRSHGPGECVLPLNSMRCSARPYPVSAAPNASGRRARTTSGHATVGIAGIHSILADSARTAAISGKSRGVSSVEKCLRTQNGTCSNEDGGDLQSLDPLITAPDLRSDTAQRAGARLAVALRTPTSSRQGASDPAWRGPERRLTIL